MLKKSILALMLCVSAGTAYASPAGSIAVGRDSDGIIVAGWSEGEDVYEAVTGAMSFCQEYGGVNCQTKVTWTSKCRYFAKSSGGPPEHYAISQSYDEAVENCSLGGQYDCSEKVIGSCMDGY